MRKLPLIFGSVFLMAVTVAGEARSEVVAGSEDVPPVSGAPMGRHAVRRGVQGPAGLFTARLSLLTNASKGSFGEPTSLAPDLYYSITDNVQIGLVHTGPMGWQSLPGVGLCLSGQPTCPKVYDNVGLDFMYGLLYGDFHLSLHSSLYLVQIRDPMASMWTIGLTGKFHFTDAVALFFDPQIGISLSNRSLDFLIYKDQLFLPVELQFQASSMLAVKVLSGVTGQLSNLGDTARVPLGLGLVANLTPSFDLGLRFSFDNLGNVPDGASRTDFRSLALLANIRI
jgi:hypothetical protein